MDNSNSNQDNRNIGIVLLAAGKSERFDGNKLRAEYHDKMLFEHAMDTIHDASTSFAKCPVYVVTAQEIIANSAAKLGYTVVINDMPELGISLSIRLGLEACLADNPNIDGVVFCVCDQPNLKSDTVIKLVKRGRDIPGSIVRLRAEGKYGNPCFWDKIYFDELLSLSGDEGGRQIMNIHEDSIVYIDVPVEELDDIDYQSDLK